MSVPAMSVPAGKPDHVYLIDGSGYIFRAFHALPPLSRSDGTPVNAVLGFTNMLLKLIEDSDAEYIAVIFDAGRRTFRNDIYADYKAHRPEAPPELIPQFALIREATRAFNVPAIEMKGYEADDLLATYATQAAALGHEVTIVSSDKDLMQLVDDHIQLFDPMKNRKIGRPEVLEKFGVAPEKVIDIQALAGDSSDNVPGVPGIGLKTAAELINTYGDLDTLLAKAGEIKQPKRRENLLANADLARISRDLVTLKRDVPIEVPLAEFDKRAIDGAALDFLIKNEFRSLASKVQSRLGEAAIKTAKAAGAFDTPAAAPSAPQGASASTSATKIGEGYELVQDEAVLASWVARATQAGQLAFDIETTSLNVNEAKLVGVSLATEAGLACYVPVGHVGRTGDLLGGGAEAPRQIPLKRAVALQAAAGRPRRAQDRPEHQIRPGGDGALRRHVAPIDDTMLISYVLEGGLHGHGMDELSSAPPRPQDDQAFKEVAAAARRRRPSTRCRSTRRPGLCRRGRRRHLRLWQLLKPRLVARGSLTTVYETLERPLPPVLAQMEQAGVKVDRRAGRLSHDFASAWASSRRIHELAGAPLQHRLAQAARRDPVRRDELPGGKKTKTGAYSTDADVLEDLAAQGHALPQRVLDWRQLAKLKSTYTDALQAAINPDTGRVHTSYAWRRPDRPAVLDRPNLQNIPIRTEEGRKIRAPSSPSRARAALGRLYSQIELRLLAHMADIPALKQAFRDGLDIHAMTASEMFGVPMEGMDPMVRRQAPRRSISASSTASRPLASPASSAFRRARPSAYIKAYFKRFPASATTWTG
jgi:DNA polymerase-1